LEDIVENTSLLACLDQVTIKSIEVQFVLPSAPLRVVPDSISCFTVVNSSCMLGFSCPLADDIDALATDRNAGLHHWWQIDVNTEMSLGVIFFLDWKSDFGLFAYLGRINTLATQLGMT